MITATHRRVGRVAVCAAYVLTMSVAGAACASTNRRWSNMPQATRAGAGVLVGSWDRVQRLQLGSPLLVTLKSGARLEGAFNGLSPEALALTDPAGKPLTIARSDIGRIVTQADDKLTNGALAGAGIGLGAALAMLAVAGSGDGYVLPSAKWGAPLLLSSAGVVVGMFIDRAHKGEEVIYMTS